MPFREWNFVFREWNFEFRELLREYPGTLRELREWAFHSESVFPELGWSQPSENCAVQHLAKARVCGRPHLILLVSLLAIGWQT